MGHSYSRLTNAQIESIEKHFSLSSRTHSMTYFVKPTMYLCLNAVESPSHSLGVQVCQVGMEVLTCRGFSQ